MRDAGLTRVERTPTGLLIRAPRPRGLGLLGKPGSVDVTIELPAGSSLHGNSSVAAFHTAGRLGEVAIKTSVGDVDLDETGRLDAQHRGRRHPVARVGGDAEISTGTGRIRVGQIDGAAVVKNSNGDTRIDAVAGDLRISAGNGDLTVGRADGNVTANAAHGEIRIGQVSRGTAAIKTGFGEIELGLRDRCRRPPRPVHQLRPRPQHPQPGRHPRPGRRPPRGPRPHQPRRHHHPPRLTPDRDRTSHRGKPPPAGKPHLQRGTPAQHVPNARSGSAERAEAHLARSRVPPQPRLGRGGCGVTPGWMSPSFQERSK